MVISMTWGCGGYQASGNSAGNIPLAVGATVVNRIRGECVATCTDGTLCNGESGLCERPCRGGCAPNEVCSANDTCTPLALWTPTSSVAQR